MRPVSSARRDELGRADDAVPGRSQRTSASTPSSRLRGDVEDRLVVDAELLALDARGAGRSRCAGARRRAGASPRRRARSGRGRRSLARYIAASASRSSVSALCGPARDRDADARRDEDLAAGADRERRARRRRRCARRRRTASASSTRPRTSDDELVAAEAGDRVDAAHDVLQARAERDEQPSPASWPSVSLTVLKPSRSSSRTATPARRAARGRRRARCGRRSARGSAGR